MARKITELNDLSDQLIILPKRLMDELLKQEHPDEVISLYCFYYYTAKWQKTNQVRATNEFCQKGLNMGQDRLLRAKKALVKLGLIQKVKNDNGWFIKINYIATKKYSEEAGKQDSLNKTKNWENQEVGKPPLNALSSDSINALSSVKEKRKSKDFPKKLKRKRVPKLYQPYDFYRGRFKILWNQEFLPIKRRKKAQTTDRALKIQLNKIQKWSEGNYDIAVEILEASILAGWSDVYPLKETKQRKSNKIGTHNFKSNKRQQFSEGKVVDN